MTIDKSGIFSPEELKEMSEQLEDGASVGETPVAREGRAIEILQMKDAQRREGEIEASTAC